MLVDSSAPNPNRSITPGAEVLDDHVGGGDQLLCRAPAIGGLEVKRDATLAAVPDRVARRVPQRTRRWGRCESRLHRGSASIIAASGPAMYWPKSITRSPSKCGPISASITNSWHGFVVAPRG